MDSIKELIEVMETLRSETGCPWDKEQNHISLKPYLIEEAYEVIDAIDKSDDEELKEELGDLLLQIIFHARIAAEEGRFDIYDVAATIVRKLKRRHPHVFGDTKVSGTDEVLSNWESIKKSEGKKSVLEGLPASLPSLLKARRIQEKVSRVGFDWPDVKGALEKVYEEIEELKRCIERGDKNEIEEEIGDILFSIVNVGRLLKIDAEGALRRTIEKFIFRFRYIENEIKKRGSRKIEEYSIEELDNMWEDSKKYI